jgi:Flp pilus assembly protein TadG
MVIERPMSLASRQNTPQSPPSGVAARGPGRKPLRRDRRGVVALELAIIAPAFFGLMLGLMELGYDLFVQAALNAAVEQAARNIQVGSVVGTTNETSAQLAQAAVCPNLRGLLNCNLLTIAVEPLPATSDYFITANPLSYGAAAGTTTNGVTTGGEICTGEGGSGRLMILEAWYNGPTFVGTLIPGWNSIVSVQGASQRVHVTAATAGFVEEDFSGGQSPCSCKGTC